MRSLYVVLLLAAGAQGAEVVTWEQRMREANQLERSGRYAEAEQAYKTTLEEAERIGPVDFRLPQSRNNLAAHYFYTGKFEEAESAAVCATNGAGRRSRTPEVRRHPAHFSGDRARPGAVRGGRIAVSARRCDPGTNRRAGAPARCGQPQ